MKRFAALLVILPVLYCACSDDPTSAVEDDPPAPPVDQHPIVTIESPDSGTVVDDQALLTFIGSAVDPQDGTLPPDSLTWESDLDGNLGKGAFLLAVVLSAGDHTISLTAKDSGGNQAADTVRVLVVEAAPEDVKVLFIGNSYFGYNDFTLMFQTLAAAGSKVVEYGEYILGGTKLDYHSTSPETEAKINEQDWDYVILQGSPITVAYPEDHDEIFPPHTYHPLVYSLKLLKEKIENNCATTRTVYLMPWAYEDGNTWVPGYDDTYFDMQLLIYQYTILFSDEVPFITAPAGWAWNTVLTEVTRDHYLHLPDYSHPSVRGTYLMACVVYATLFREDLEGIDYYADLPEDDALYFQAVAADIVLDDLRLWNIIQ